MWVVLWSLGWVAVEDYLAEAHNLLREWASSGACPGCQPVVASHQRVDEEARVFQEPFYNR